MDSLLHRRLRLRDRIAYALSTARGVPIEQDLRVYSEIVRRIRSIDLSARTDAELRRAALGLRRMGPQTDDRSADPRVGAPDLPLVFALAAEACRRHLRVEPFETQLLAAVAMSQGKLAQMQTGEGKTLAAVFPVALQALSGRGAHVMTANDYLARRDAQWMGPIYRALGLAVAAIGAESSPRERREAYRADVTYLTAREAGFDYLRDRLCFDAQDQVQRGHAAALVDEADSILIDEARVPLVIAGTDASDDVDVRRVDAVVRELRSGTDFEVDREGRRVALLLPGHRRVERGTGTRGIHTVEGSAVFARMHAALHAHHLLRRDVDYVVREGRIELVDAFTGRIADRRQWPWGVQPALEAKEGLAIQPEGRVYGSITVQHYLALYDRLAAMTATAVPSAEELFEVYGLSVAIVPTERPSARIDLPDRLFDTKEEKLPAVVDEIVATHARGQPVLVGTASVLESEELSAALASRGLSCRVLNAKNHEREAALVARAGERGAVTISTNMAGRGTDIRIAEGVAELGGLYVMGTNRHESRRVDDQLRGRAGRQGEPGCSRFFVSLEDPLFQRYGVREFLRPDAPSGDPRAPQEIRRAQAIIEAQNHRIRSLLRKYTRLVELQRMQLCELREAALREGRLPPALEAACPGPDAMPRLRAAFLGSLDRFWADHLLAVEEVREGIGLERYASRDPGLGFLHRVGEAFDDGLRRIEECLVDACRRLPSDPGALDPGPLGAARPSSTWTYQVDEGPPVAFSVAGLTSAGAAGAAAGLAAGPLLPILAIVEMLSRWVGGKRSRRQPSTADGTRGRP